MNYDFYDDMSIINGYMPYNNIPNNNEINYNSSDNLNLFNPYEGYLKGNAFKNEYVPYKNYKVAKLNINNERDEMLINIGQYSFMMHDMNLLLDINPNNKEALKKFSEYRNKLNELVIRYERKYGPLMVKSEVDDATSFNWLSNWPWVN